MPEYKVKHLEIVQSNIDRMNRCSFQIKGWNVTIISALLALYASSVEGNNCGNVIFLLIGIVPAFLFWVLDAYYLQQERKFRAVYNDLAAAINGTGQIAMNDFEIPLNRYQRGKYSLIIVLFSKTEVMLYLPIIIGLLFAGVILG